MLFNGRSTSAPLSQSADLFSTQTFFKSLESPGIPLWLPRDFPRIRNQVEKTSSFSDAVTGSSAQTIRNSSIVPSTRSSLTEQNFPSFLEPRVLFTALKRLTT